MSYFLAQTEEEVNVAAIDRWTWTHVGVGFGMGLLRLNPFWTLAMLIGYEIVEPALEDKWPGIFQNPNNESTRNHVADVLAAWVGYSLGRVV